eukprot:4334782-Prymnesium_polylepis.1
MARDGSGWLGMAAWRAGSILLAQTIKQTAQGARRTQTHETPNGRPTWRPRPRAAAIPPYHA